MKYPNIRDFDFTFESQGTKFILEDIVRKFYLPAGSVGIVREGKDYQYIGKSMVEKMKKIGEERTKEETFAAGQKVRELCAQAIVLKQAISNKKELLEEETNHCLETLQSIIHEYFYFDFSYWDGAFNRAESDPLIKENIELVERLKNDLRSNLEEFFGEESLLNVLLDKLAEQFKILPKDIQWYIQDELLPLFEAKKVPEKILSLRTSSVYWHDEKNVLHIFFGKEAEDFIKEFLQSREKPDSSVIFGKVAHGKGRKITGRARVLKRNYDSLTSLEQDMKAMAKGEILVSQTTDPQLMPAFYKAAAVVTDVGGMLSHAAISARELDIPCIVETKNASKMLKTGDAIEVDAKKGRVKILERTIK